MQGVRALAALLLLAALIGAISQVSAQDIVDASNDAASPTSYGADPGDGSIDANETTDDGVVEDPGSVSDGAPEIPAGGVTGEEEDSSTPEPDPITDDGGVEAESLEGDFSTDEVLDVQAEEVFVSVFAFDCNVDPGAGDPAESADCTASQGLEVDVVIDDAAAGVQTTGVDGSATFGAPEGSILELTENAATIVAGYHSIGSGSAELTAAQDASVTFVHLAEPIAGRLQIVNGSCPTTGESRTEFRVIEPQSVAMASSPACQATGGTVFTIQGESLGGGISVVTGSDGAWRGYLVPGDYTVIDDSGASAVVTVIANDISVVIVVDYVSAPLGLLNVSRFACTVDDESGTEISFGLSEPTVGDDDGCEATAGDIAIDVVEEVSAADVATIDLGSDGVGEIELPGGSYILTDLLTGESESFELEGGTRLYAVVQELKIGDDGVGEDPDGTAAPTETKTPDDGTGGGGGTGPTPTETPDDGDGTGTDNGGGGETTDGDIDTGSSDDGTDDDGDELAGVTTLPSAGAHISKRDQTQAYVMFGLLAAALSVGAFGGRRVVLRRAELR